MMKRKWHVCLSSLLLALMVTSCGSTNSGDSTNSKPEVPSSANETVSLKLGLPAAPPTLPVLHMLETNALGENVDMEIEIWNGPEQLIAMVQNGEQNMFAFPLTVVSKLYQSGLDVRLLDVNTWGVTYFTTSDPSLQTWEDLRGKTVYIPLQSSPPDALTQYFLNQAGLIAGKDYEIIYATPAEVSSLLASGQAEYATQIEPQLTAAITKNPNLRRALSFEEEWQKATETDTMIPNAGLGTTQEFIDSNPELIQAFQEAYAESLQWVLDHPKEAGDLASAYLGLDAAIVEQAIPNMGLHFKTATDARPELEAFYQLLYDFNPDMIGGKIPDSGLYYEPA